MRHDVSTNTTIVASEWVVSGCIVSVSVDVVVVVCIVVVVLLICSFNNGMFVIVSHKFGFTVQRSYGRSRENYFSVDGRASRGCAASLFK